MAKVKFSQPYHIRIQKLSDDEARRIARQSDLDILDVLRMAIKHGLPIVAKRLMPAKEI